MNMFEAIKVCFQKYATFSGRARRSEFWWFFLFSFVLGLIPVVSVISGLVLLIPGLAVGWRRMHDIGRPGYHYLMPLAVILLVGLAFAALASLGFAPTNGSDPSPVFIALFAIAALAVLGALIVQIVWLASSSQRGPNEYGPEPGAEVRVEGVFD